MAIDEIKNYIQGKVDKEAQELIRRANLVKEREISQAKKRLEEWLSEATKEFMKEKIALVATYKSRTFKEISLEKTRLYEELWQDFLGELKIKLREVTTTKRYRDILLKMVMNVLSSNDCQIEVLVRKEDVGIFEEVKNDRLTILEADILGGIILRKPAQGLVLNYSFDEILATKQQALKSMFIGRLGERSS